MCVRVGMYALFVNILQVIYNENIIFITVDQQMWELKLILLPSADCIQVESNEIVPDLPKLKHHREEIGVCVIKNNNYTSSQTLNEKNHKRENKIHKWEIVFQLCVSTQWKSLPLLFLFTCSNVFLVFITALMFAACCFTFVDLRM